MATVTHRIVYPKLGIIDEFVEEIPDDETAQTAESGDDEKNK